jgi:flagellar motor switch protein FliN/FliY
MTAAETNGGNPGQHPHPQPSPDGLNQPFGAMSDSPGGAMPEGASGADPGNLDFILDIPLEISVELGRSSMVINELLKLGQGSIIELGKLAGETLEVLANQKLVARGEVVVMNDKYAVRLTEIISPMERIEGLK